MVPVMGEDIQVEDNKPITDRFLRQFTPLQLALIIGIAFWFYYLTRLTSPVPNYDAVTRTIIYAPDSLVVPHSVTLGHAIIGMILVIFLVSSFFTDKFKKIDAAEAIRIAKKELILYRDAFKLAEYNGEIKMYAVKLRRTEGRGERVMVPDEWIVGAAIKHKIEEFTRHFEIHIDPVTGMVQGVLNREDRPLEVEDFVKGGLLPDSEYVTTDDLKRARVARGFMTDKKI